MSETSSSSSTANNNNNNNSNKKKSLYETIFKSKEFMLDVYIRFDCLLYFILSVLSIYSPDGFKNVVNYGPHFPNPNYIEPNKVLDTIGQNNDDDGSLEELLSNQQNPGNEKYDSVSINKFYENQIFLNIVSMYSILLAVVTLIQSIIAFRILISKDKSIKQSNINLLLIVDFLIIIFNSWLSFTKSQLFIPMGAAATILTLVISIIDFLFLFFLSSSNKTFIQSIKSSITSITSFSKNAKKVYKDELKKKKQEIQQQKKEKLNKKN